MGIQCFQAGQFGHFPESMHNFIEGRGGYSHLKVDLSEALNQPPPEGAPTHEEIWERTIKIFSSVVPVAESAGVNVAMHGNDPPVPSLYGVPQVLYNFAAFDRLFSEVPSPNNGMTFCVGTRYESGEDVFEGIRHFGEQGKIFHVHFRNVRGKIPEKKGYEEVIPDAGDMDMYRVAKALHDVGYGRRHRLRSHHATHHRRTRRQGVHRLLRGAHARIAASTRKQRLMLMIETRLQSLSTFRFQQCNAVETEWIGEGVSCSGLISHFVSTRIGGLSPPPYESLNLGFHVEDNPETVLQNRERFAANIGIPLSDFTIPKQVHSGTVTIVTEEMRGYGAADLDTAVEATDAMITDVPRLCLTVLAADCVLVLFYDPQKQVIAAVHAGWRGTVKLAAQKTAETLKQEFNCKPTDILVGIGPSIGPCHYEVGPEVISQVEDTFGSTDGYINNKPPMARGILICGKQTSSKS